jgi:DNA-binding NarL/FixJ family response regulator
MTDTTRVLIVDDHELVRAGLRGVLDAEPGIEVVSEAADGVQAVAAAEMHHPDVVVMDLQMPAMDGIEATRRILSSRPGTAVLVVTMFDDDDSIFAAVRAGARGYVLKGAGRRELRAAVVSVASGQTVFGPGVAAKVMEAMLAGSQSIELFPELTVRERQVLESLVEGLAPAAVGRRLGISEKTVRNNISSVLTKLQVEDRRAAVELARQRGIVGPPTTANRAVIFADLENAALLMRQLSDRYVDFLAEHNRVLDAALSSAGGRSFGVSADARFASFDQAATAIAGAVAIRRAVEDHPFRDGVNPSVRIGVHAGIITDHGGVVVGLAVHETARVAAAANGGQVVVSEDAYPRNEPLPVHIGLRDVGVHDLRDVDRPLRLYEVDLV